MVEAYDEFNNRIYPVVIHTICPVALSNEGREACLNYMNSGAEDAVGHSIESMLSSSLRMIGTEPVSHIHCQREGYTHQVDRLRGYLAGLDLAYVDKVIYTSGNLPSPESLENKLVIIVGAPEVVLPAIGLQEVT